MLKLRRELLKQARYRAKKYGIEFNIELDDIQVPEYCPILKIKLYKNDKRYPCNNSPTLDRIDPSKGYTKGNIQVISHKANTMKSSADVNDLISFASWVLTYLQKVINKNNEYS